LRIIHSKQSLPTEIVGQKCNGSLFLGGALPRSDKINQEPAHWRSDAYRFLAERFDGTVLTPERQEGSLASYVSQADWEQAAQNSADVIFYYMTRTADILALSTNTEVGQYIRFGPQRVVLCIPENADLAMKTEFQQTVAKMQGIEPIIGLEAGLEHAISLIGEGAERHGGECQVPLYVWRTPSFQAWNNALKAAGNRLDNFHLDMTLCPVPAFVLFWAAKVSIWVAGEERHKDNEWVISRPDISHCVLVYRKGPKTHIVGVREFRSTVRNADGYVYEAAGGSSAKPSLDPIQVAIDEVREETGLRLRPAQLRFVASRQLAATTTAHHAYVTVAELTDEQYQQALAQEGTYAGDLADSEMTALTVSTLTELFAGEELDWSNLGMTAQALLQLDAEHKPKYTVASSAGQTYALVILDALTGSALDTILGIMAAGTTVVYAGPQQGNLGFEQRVDIATTLGLFADKLTQQGIDAQFIHLAGDGEDQLRRLQALVEPDNLTVFAFVGDYGLSPDAIRQVQLMRHRGVSVVGSWCGSTPQPELLVVNGSLAAPDIGYVPFARQWSQSGSEVQICTPQDCAVVSVGRLTPAAYYRLAGLLIAGTHLIYGGAPVDQEAPEGRIHLTRSLRLMAAKLGVAGIPARVTTFEEPDVESRRLKLLALAQQHCAPVLAFVDDQGLAPGVAQECAWARDCGLPVTGLWVGSSGGFELRTLGDALDVNEASLQPLAQMRQPGLVLA